MNTSNITNKKNDKNVEIISNEVVSLPIHSGITNNDIDYIADIIKNKGE